MLKDFISCFILSQTGENEQFYIPSMSSAYEKNLTAQYERIKKHGRTSNIKKLNHLPKKG